MLDLYDELSAIVDTLASRGLPYALCGGSRCPYMRGLIALKRFRSSKQDLLDIEHLEGE